VLEMLDFVAEKKLKAWVQTMPMKEANQALRDFGAGKPRYRLVLVNEQDKN
jgi:alcohol dehydrogenase (NADP+)